jgi:hypothetical protein
VDHVTYHRFRQYDTMFHRICLSGNLDYRCGETLTNQISAHAIQKTVLPVSSQVGICDTLRVATELLVWSHDKPGSAALSGQELAYSWADTSGVWHPWQQVTDDSLADWTPRAAFVNDETALAVWQRFDSSTPGDPNADPGGYVSHLQVAAARWSAASNTWRRPSSSARVAL